MPNNNEFNINDTVKFSHGINTLPEFEKCDYGLITDIIESQRDGIIYEVYIGFNNYIKITDEFLIKVNE